MVGDRELYNAATELTRIMGRKIPGRFFNDPTAVNPQNRSAPVSAAGTAQRR
jgi:hypothetical protein